MATLLARKKTDPRQTGPIQTASPLRRRPKGLHSQNPAVPRPRTEGWGGSLAPASVFSPAAKLTSRARPCQGADDRAGATARAWAGRRHTILSLRREARQGNAKNGWQRTLAVPSPTSCLRERIGRARRGADRASQESSCRESARALSIATNALWSRISCFFPAPRCRTATVPACASFSPTTAMYGTFCSSASRIL